MSDLLKYLGANALACTVGGVAGFFTPIPGGAAAGCGLALITVNASRCGTESGSQNPDIPTQKPDMGSSIQDMSTATQAQTIEQYEKTCKPLLDKYCAPETIKPLPEIPKDGKFYCSYFYPDRDLGWGYLYPYPDEKRFSVDAETRALVIQKNPGLCFFYSGVIGTFTRNNEPYSFGCFQRVFYNRADGQKFDIGYSCASEKL